MADKVIMDSVKAATSMVSMTSVVPNDDMIEISSRNSENNLHSSMKAITSLVTMGKEDEEPTESWHKKTIMKYQNNNINDQKELQRLNMQLKNYLENVRVLEALNKTLIIEVDKARLRALPQLMDKSKLDETLEAVRLKLEDESTDCVIHQARLDEIKALTDHLNTRLKFYHNEEEIQRQKITALQNQLAEIKNSREYIVRSAELAQDNIAREKTRIFQSEKDLEGLRSKLRNGKSKNKQIEFEMQTMLDEIEFRKAVFHEEKNEITKRQQNGRVLDGVDLSNFYRNELVSAVRQIREDFHNLSDQQLAQYKELKEAELKFHMHQAQQERIAQENLKSKMESMVSVELQNSSELRAYSERFGPHVAELQSVNNALTLRLSHMEAALRDMKARNQDNLQRKMAETDLIKGENEFYSSELTQWDMFHRTKLETEIQTYRSILNSQLKLMKSDSYYSYEVVKAEPVREPSPQIVYIERDRTPSPRPSQIIYRDRSPTPEPKVVYIERERSPTPEPVYRERESSRPVHVTREVLVPKRERSESASRDKRASSAKVFDTQIKQDKKQHELIEQGRVTYQTTDLKGGSQKKYDTVEIIKSGMARPTVTFSYVDVIRRYDTGDSERIKLLNGKFYQMKLLPN